jgi:polysaccharide export outer membrane protein
MVRPPVPILALACAAVMLLVSASAQAQMTAGGLSGLSAVESAQQAQASGTAVVAQPSSSYSNPYSNNGVAGATTARPTINGQGDPYAANTQQGAATGQYATPLGAPSIMPTALQTTPNTGQAYGGSQGYYGGAGEPTAAPNYTVQSEPANSPYAPAPQAYAPQQQQQQQPYSLPYTPAQQQYGQPAYAQPQYAQQPQYAPPQPQYAPTPQYAPQYAPPQQYAPAPQQYAQPQANANMPAMAPGNNLIASPYAAMRQASNPGPNPGAPQMEGGYTVGPGDKVRLTIFGEPELSGEIQVDGNGNIRLPLAGMVHAAGNTPQTLEAVILGALVPNYLRNPRINVEITSYRPIYVVGQVQKPGQYAYANNMTMQNLIGLAGGFTPQAKESVVYVKHEGETREQEVSSAQPLLVRPGDTIRVDTTLFWDAMNLLSPLSTPASIAASRVQ